MTRPPKKRPGEGITRSALRVAGLVLVGAMFLLIQAAVMRSVIEPVHRDVQALAEISEYLVSHPAMFCFVEQYKNPDRMILVCTPEPPPEAA
jgi:hypothetical protein